VLFVFSSENSADVSFFFSRPVLLELVEVFLLLVGLLILFFIGPGLFDRALSMPGLAGRAALSIDFHLRSKLLLDSGGFSSIDLDLIMIDLGFEAFGIFSRSLFVTFFPYDVGVFFRVEALAIDLLEVLLLFPAVKLPR